MVVFGTPLHIKVTNEIVDDGLYSNVCVVLKGQQPDKTFNLNEMMQNESAS
jgi:hypothetical protein